MSLTAGMHDDGMATLPTRSSPWWRAARGGRRRSPVGPGCRTAGDHPVGITDGQVVDMINWTRGLRATAQPLTALHHLEQIRDAVVRRMAALDLFDAAVRTGRLDVLRAWLDEVVAFAEGDRYAERAGARRARSSAAGRGPAAEEFFEASLAAHARSRRLPDRARTELAYGEHLRRARRRVDAREHCVPPSRCSRTSVRRPWAERAAQELRASGETARRRDVSTATDLTAQERQVAALVRQGCRNRDVAAQLFVSPRTVDFHLRNVFSKLGVASRAELTALSLDL
jgi:DNA-binding NarL/FixJ family response regulator